MRRPSRPDHARFQPGLARGWGGLRPPRGARRETGQTGQDNLDRHPQAGVRHTAAGQRDRGGHQEDKHGLVEETEEGEQGQEQEDSEEAVFPPRGRVFVKQR